MFYTEGVFPVPVLNQSSNFYTFPTEFNDLLLRKQDAEPLRIFLREENRNIAGKLDEFFESSDTLFYLQGPPGVGKTKESIIWLIQSMINASKVESLSGPWVWIPLTKSGKTQVNSVYLLDRINGRTDAVKFRKVSTSHLAEDLVAWGVTMAVLDNCNEENRGAVDLCVVLDIKTVAVSSLQMRFDSSYSRQQSYVVNGWTKAEYMEACKDDDFYSSVKTALQTGDFTDDELDNPALRDEVVTAKYHIAGGSARWMFQFSADQLLAPAGSMESIHSHLDRVSQNQIVSGFIGDRSVTEVNHLLSRIDGRPTIVSQYVANQLVDRFGTALLKQALLLASDANPSMDGILLEMDFMLRLGKSTHQKDFVYLVMKPGADPEPVFDSGGKKIMYRMSTFPKAKIDVNDGDWFIPQIFNNGGFDGVQYRAGKLIFVQITRAATHSFNLEWFQKFLKAFVQKFPHLKVEECEVWFIVPEENIGTFKPAESSGVLTGYKHGTYKVAGMRRIRA